NPRAERDLRGYPLIGAQQLLRLPDRLEQHLGPEVLPEQLGLEHAIRPEISELFDLLTPRHEVPAAGRLDDLVHVDQAARRLAGQSRCSSESPSKASRSARIACSETPRRRAAAR